MPRDVDNPMVEERIALHDLLLRDWGTDLPIRGGYGGSREDPIVITATDADDVATTRLLTLKGLGRGRRIFWRTIAHTLLDDPRPGIEQFKIETARLTDTQIITQTENYYFDVSAMIAAQQRWLSPRVVVHHDVSGLAFPFEIGWLVFDGATNYEPHAPGLGYSVCYKAPGITATLYVYDRGMTTIPDDVAESAVQDEFERAAGEIATAQPDLHVAWADHPKNPDCLERYYRVGDDWRRASLLWLTTTRRRFLKARVTWDRDQFIDRAAQNFVSTILANTRNSTTRSMTNTATQSVVGPDQTTGMDVDMLPNTPEEELARLEAWLVRRLATAGNPPPWEGLAQDAPPEGSTFQTENDRYFNSTSAVLARLSAHREGRWQRYNAKYGADWATRLLRAIPPYVEEDVPRSQQFVG
jgi:hypothetical protein